MGITFHNRGNITAVSVHDITFSVKVVMEDLGSGFAKNVCCKRPSPCVGVSKHRLKPGLQPSYLPILVT